MPRIVFLCPSDDTPTGGVKVIYRHCEMLAKLGADAVVLHPFDPSFRCSWFAHDVRFASGPQIDPRHDFVIVPELWALPFGQQCRDVGVRYGIFVQNGYLTHALLPGHTRAALEAVYGDAALILSISKDSSRMVRCNYPHIAAARLVPVRYSIGPHFHPTPDETATTPARRITFMPRKLADHSGRVVFALAGHLPPDWEIVPIHNVAEATCTELLFSSSIFMAFSSFEGLPLPPLEAAIAGNLVIGTTGQGAREYWQAPSFREIAQGDIIGFIAAVADAAHAFEHGAIDRGALRACGAALARRFSPAAELSDLGSLRDRIAGLFTAVGTRALARVLEPA